jgi:basic amino acid/polyamine antiporter, APA family
VALGAHSPAWWAVLVVVALTLVNLASLRLSANAHNWLTVAEVGGLLLVCAAGLVGPAAAAPASDAAAAAPGIGAVGFALVFVLLIYGGWNEAAYVSAEMRGGPRAILHTLVAGIAIIAALYLATNVALLHGLGVTELAASKAAAADLVTRAFGAAAGDALAALVAVATLTSINATMLVGARTHFALAHDWRPLQALRGWNAARGVPVAAFVAQTGIALALIAFGAAQKDGFEAMVEFTAPVFWGFLTLVGVSLIVLRRRDRDVPRPFRVPLYPLTPMLFIAACAFLFHSSVTYAASRSALHVSLLVMATGAAVWMLTRRR